MNIGDSVTFVENGETQTGTISWVSPEYVFIKDQSGEIKKIQLTEVSKNN